MSTKRQAGKGDAARRKPGHEWYILAGILLLGALLRMFYLRELVQAPDFTFPRADMGFHDYWARAMVTDDWTPPVGADDPQIRSTPFLRPPGYPFFLALVYAVCGTSYLAPRLVQMGLGLVNSVLAFLLGRSLFGRAVGLILAAFMAFYWVFIYFEGELSAPVLLIFLNLALLNLLRSWTSRFACWRALGAGMLLGLCALTAPNVLVLPPVVLIWGWWLARQRGQQRRFGVIALSLGVGVLAMIVPVTLRNYLVANDLVLISCNGGVTLYAGNNERSDGVTATLADTYGRAGVAGWGWFNYHVIVSAIESELSRPMKYSEVSAYFSRKALTYMTQHPKSVLRLMLKKALLFWGPAEISTGKVIDRERKDSAVLRYGPGFSVFLALGILGSILMLLDSRRACASQMGGASSEYADGMISAERLGFCLLIWGFVATYFLSFVPFLVSARFRTPIIPFVLLFAAYAIYRTMEFISERNWRSLVLWGVIGSGVYFVVSWPFYRYESSAMAWHLHRGQGYQRLGRLDEAVGEFREALRLDPGNFLVRFNLATVLFDREEFDSALTHARRSVQLRPDIADAQLILGKTLLKTGGEEEGMRHLEEVLHLAPDNLDAHGLLGVAYLQKRAYDQATYHFKQILERQPRHSRAHLMLGNTFAAERRWEEAAESFRRALEVDDAYTDAHYRLALVLRELKQWDDAEEELRRVLQLEPSHQQARQLLEMTRHSLSVPQAPTREDLP